MPTPPHYRKKVRQRIVRSAALLFNRHGFPAVSIDDIMAGAGLTRGGFYKYFESKSELYVETISHFVEKKREAVVAAEKATDRASHLVRDYLSLKHLEGADASCPLIGLTNILSGSDQSVRSALESPLRLMIETFEHGVKPTGDPARQLALALTSLCVGGMVLARAVEDRSLADELREAATAIALKLGDWT